MSLWNTTTGALQAKVEGFTNEFHRNPFSPDGKLLVFQKEAVVSIWSTNTGALRATFEADYRSSGIDGNFLSFSPNSKLLALKDGDLWPSTLRVWNIIPENLQIEAEGYNWNGCVSFSCDSKLFAFVREEPEAIEVWDVDTGTLQVILRVSGLVGQIHFSPNNMLLAATTLGPDNTGIIELSNLTTGVFPVELEDYAGWRNATVV